MAQKKKRKKNDFDKPKFEEIPIIIIFSVEQFMVLYSGNYLPADLINNFDQPKLYGTTSNYYQRYGVCLETQNIPNAVNFRHGLDYINQAGNKIGHGHVDHSVYTAQNPYYSKTLWRFSTS